MSNSVELATENDFYKIDVWTNPYKLKPALIFPDDQSLWIQDTNGSNCRLALKILDKIEASLHFVDWKTAIPTAYKDIVLGCADAFCLICINLSKFTKVWHRK